MGPRGQRWLPGFEGSDASFGHLGWQLGRHPAGAGERPVSGAWLLFFALSLKRSGDCAARRYSRHARRGASRGRRPVQSDAEFVALESVLRAARQTASLRRLAGAETALFH